MRSQILIFGSQALSFDAAAAQELQVALAVPAYAWIRETIEQLPVAWSAAAAAVPSLDGLSGSTYLEDLQQWVCTGSFRSALPLPNILLTPLVVIHHLVQYSQFLKLVKPDFTARTESLGLCTGLLSAAAASCSGNIAELSHYGRVAIRLAVLIGAAVDAQVDASEPRSLSIAWGSELDQALPTILEQFPRAYVSVLLEERRATLTADRQCVDVLQETLRAAGYRVHDVLLRGHFHYPGNRAIYKELLEFCDAHPDYHFREPNELLLPARSNIGGRHILGRLHRTILKSILVQQSDWHNAFANIQAPAGHDALVIAFGKERCIPASLARKQGIRFIHLAGLDLRSTNIATAVSEYESAVRYAEALATNGVAVIGMSCHLPGANDLDEFWQLLCSGESQHREVPTDRFTFNTFWRANDEKQKWYGNFIDNYDTFDHKFFKKSPREMSSSDPQHRIMIQVAYHAVEQSGYFHTDQDKHIGCYVGVGPTDYERNIACAPATAYSATGNLKAFTAGKISHHFGWTGPGLTIDTACSSSAVAVHSACRAILSGECSAALAGGVNVMSSPEWFQNLAGASFLSPTGQCKPFDAKADGYCRGEGAGAVFLKKLTTAIADGDQIFGVIGASMVYQNENSTAITVPNSPSLSSMFRTAIDQAGVKPEQISYVEAHGTGTPVGDPPEYDSIRQVLGGRARQLSLGSVKGLVGHLESGSGIAALLKTLVMIQHRSIPPQASHDTINPSINASPSDRMEIARAVKPWTAEHRGALINNYGASGSNACLVVTQPPEYKALRRYASEAPSPFWICASDDQRLRDYACRLRKFLKPEMAVSDLAFQISRQSNRELRQALIFSCSSTVELERNLEKFEGGATASTERPDMKSVVLCFGGQVSTWVGLDRAVYEDAAVFRGHVDRCDAACQKLGLKSIFPAIFQRSPIEDITVLQTILFANQYACARTWIDCGVRVDAMVGHSFGELTALCVAGVLVLEDAIKLIACRSCLIKESWGSDRGMMMAVEGDISEVQRLLAAGNKLAHDPVRIACYNTQRSFTLAGSTEAIHAVEKIAGGFALKTKKLNVSHAFHSHLAEPLAADLERISQSMQFHPPQIPIEHAKEVKDDQLNARYIAEHMRNPVYFSHAVERLAKRYPSCVWLEAGSNSTVTAMISRALGPSASHFQAVNITQDNSMRFLVDTILNLWKQGLDVKFWPHHRTQTKEYDGIILPPYQFEKSRHWIDWKAPPKTTEASPQLIEPPKELWTFVSSDSECSVRFRINASSQRFQEMVGSHVFAQTAPICPTTLQVQIAIDALMSIAASADPTLQPQPHDIACLAPMSIDPSRTVWLDVRAADQERRTWEWTMTSNAENSAVTTQHVSGRVVFRAASDPVLLSELARWERFVRYDRCQKLLNDADPDEVIKGPRIYNRCAEIFEYGEIYRGLQKIVCKGDESAGRIFKRRNKDAWFDTSLAETFCQVSGMFVNGMTDHPSNEAYVTEKIDQWARSLVPCSDWPDVWEVFAMHHRPADKKYVSDVFVFDPRSGRLLEVIVGIHYQLVPVAVLTKALTKVTQPGAAPKVQQAPEEALPQQAVGLVEAAAPPKKLEGPDVSGIVKNIVANLAGMEPETIDDDLDMINLGIDSLMSMELGREIGLAFNCALVTDRFIELTDFRSLVEFVRRTIGLSSDHGNQSDHAPTKMNGTLTPNHEVPNAAAAELPGLETRQKTVEAYLRKYTEQFARPSSSPGAAVPTNVVLVTGASGSLGSHLVAHLARLSNVERVICINRNSTQDPRTRQLNAFTSRGIALEDYAQAKLQVIETDTSQALLGLSSDQYERLLDVTAIVHNAWPMSITRPIDKFTAQFQVMQNLIDLASRATSRRPPGFKFGFQFLSSIAAVGMHSLRSEMPLIPEERMDVGSAIPNGYGESKIVCEHMLEATLRQHPDCFRSMVVRIGQIAGSTDSGYWNHVELFAFLLKSSQSLKALPDFDGDLSWLPVTTVAATLSDLLLADNTPHLVYHVENPLRQPWQDMIQVLANALAIPSTGIVPFAEWVRRMREFPGPQSENPAVKLADLYNAHFVRMSCGGLILETDHAREHSPTLRRAEVVSDELVRKFIRAWKNAGFLH